MHDNVRDDVFTLAKDFNEYDSINDIIHQARELLVSRGYTFYNRKRLMVVPKSIVNEILGTEVA
ncbi:DUF3173 family protein [Streptococcus constellatus]|nr:DUF3173 family protein [Streptococcus constellatus]